MIEIIISIILASVTLILGFFLSKITKEELKGFQKNFTITLMAITPSLYFFSFYLLGPKALIGLLVVLIALISPLISFYATFYYFSIIASLNPNTFFISAIIIQGFLITSLHGSLIKKEK